MNHEGLHGALVSHGSSTVPQYIVDEINALGGAIQNAYGISKESSRPRSRAASARSTSIPISVWLSRAICVSCSATVRS